MGRAGVVPGFLSGVMGNAKRMAYRQTKEINFPHTILNVLHSGNAVLCVIAGSGSSEECDLQRFWAKKDVSRESFCPIHPFRPSIITASKKHSILRYSTLILIAKSPCIEYSISVWFSLVSIRSVIRLNRRFKKTCSRFLKTIVCVVTTIKRSRGNFVSMRCPTRSVGRIRSTGRR